ncbi:MAG: 2-hydroxyacid dehydrogenase [Dehalococcoidia bacterium]
MLQPKPRVFVTRRLPGTAVERLGSLADVDLWAEPLPPPRSVLLERAREADGLICLLTERIDDELLQRCPRLVAACNVAVGFDNIDVPAATRAGVFVTNTPGVLTETTADFAFALLMAAGRRVVEGDRYTRTGDWKTWDPALLLGTDLHGATLGLIGVGQIGSAVARRAQGFSMRVLYHDAVRRTDLEETLGLVFADLDTLLRESDFVSLHVPLLPATKHLLGDREFALMKPSAVLVNTSRGPVVDGAALYRALRAGQPAAAALDVTEVEPIGLDDPLLTLPNLIVTPHIASGSLSTRAKMAELAVDNFLAAWRGDVPPTCLNSDVAAHLRTRRPA